MEVEAADQLKPFPNDWERALFVVAHPDDIEWCGSSAIAAFTRVGKHVDYLLVTRGEAGIDSLSPDECGPLREAEQVAAGKAVGVDNVEFLDYADGRIEYGVGLRRELARAIRRLRPDGLLTLNPYDRWGSGAGAGWNSADHRAVGLAVVDAASDAGNRWIFPELLDDGLEPWSSKWIAIGGSPQPTHAVDVTGCVEAGITALAEHRRYIEEIHDGDHLEFARGVVTGQTTGTARRFGGKEAIAFEVIGG